MTFWAIQRDVPDHPADYWGAIHGWTSKLRAVRFQRREDAAAVLEHIWGNGYQARSYQELLAVEVTL